jgi:hypothetical protein
MATRTWNGGSGAWTDPTQWAGGVAPQLDDTEIVAGGTLTVAAAGTLDAATLDLGSGTAAAQAVLQSDGALFGYRFTLDSAGAAGFATLSYSGDTAFNGVINATARGGTLTLAPDAQGGTPADLILLDGSALNVSGGDTVDLSGTLTLHSTVTIGSGGDFVNFGTIDQASAALEVDSGGTLAGSGLVEIGFYSSLYFQSGAAASSQSIRFADVGGRLLIADPANYTGQISNFQQGDLIDLTATIANYASYDAGTGILTVENSGTVVATLNVQGPASGVLTTVPGPDGTGTIIEVTGTQPRVNYTITADDHAMQSDVARETLTTAAGTPINGAGVKIGIISSSFDQDPGTGTNDVANAAALAGYLPLNAATGTSAVTVLSDAIGSGDDNEGLAMAELAHQVAPGAQLYFATAEGGLDTFANAVTLLQQAGCQVIVDDIGYDEEPFFQNAGTLDTAIESAVASGVSYFTAAGNDGSAAFQAAYAPSAVTLDDGTRTEAEIFGNGTPYQTLTLQAGVTTTLALQWAAPWPTGSAAVTPLLSAELYDTSGTLVQSSYTVADAPEVELSITPSVTTQYQLAIYGSLTAGTEFKYVLLGAENGGTTVAGTIDDPAADTGTIKGHALLPDVNSVGAVAFTSTPVFGGSGLASEFYSSTGASDLLFAPNGTALATPEAVAQPDIAAPVGAATSLAAFQPFGGTSAAAPNAAAVAALMLQADPALTPAQVTTMLEQSATDLGLPASEQGAGLVNGDKAVELALAAACYAAGTRIATARGLQPIEQLRHGDLVATESGAFRPVRWLGRRRIDCRRHPRPHEVWPIRVQAHAFAPQQPVRDLLLSPDHAVKLDGALIPVRYLVNGATIAPRRMARICYWHVELDRHDVLRAEGLPCESFLDTGNRRAFANGGTAIHLFADFTARVWDADSCAALTVAGPALDAARMRVAASLDQRLTGSPSRAR